MKFFVNIIQTFRYKDRACPKVKNSGHRLKTDPDLVPGPEKKRTL